MTLFVDTFGKMRGAAESLGVKGKPLCDALDAWEKTGGPAGYKAISDEILMLDMTGHRKASQIDKSAKALCKALGGTP